MAAKEIQTISSGRVVQNISIVFRGEHFRGSFAQQQKCFESVVSKIIIPARLQGICCRIIFATYEDKKSFSLKSLALDIFSGCTKGVEFNFLKRKALTGQAESFIFALQQGEKNNESVLVLRPDLCFTKTFVFSSFYESAFLFQWNYFHDFLIKEVPDQFHFVGCGILSKVILGLQVNIETLGLLSNGTGKGTLHNLFNVCSKYIGLEEISYIFKFNLSSEDFVNSKCLLRGNPDFSKLNDVYTYERVRQKDKLIFRVLRKLREIIT